MNNIHFQSRERMLLSSIMMLIIFLIGAGKSFAQNSSNKILVVVDDSKPIEVKKMPDDVDIKIDGKIDEIAWKELNIYDPYKVTNPDTLEETKYETKTRFFYTSEGLYVSMEMEQPRNTHVKRYLSRDDWQTKSDKVGLTIDTSGDGKYGYWFSLGLGDSEGDGTLMPEKIYSSDWDGAWYGATSDSDDGWSAEYYIPWSQVAMPKDADDRIINIHSIREVAHLNEEWSWPPVPDSVPQFISLFQPARVNNVNLKQQWSVFPYASSSYDRIDNESLTKAGADFFWRPSTNAQFTATINPDFGAVEADNVVVNLSANETFFPEKRLFFQEGNEIFVATPRASDYVWGGRNKVTVINTRRIGSRPDLPDVPEGVSFSKRIKKTTKADLIGALKTTGQIEKFRYGVLLASEDETDLLADDNQIYNQVGRDFGAFRLLYENTDNGDTRGLGFISTTVSKPGKDSVVNAADIHYLSETGVWKADGQYIHTNTDEYGSGKGGFFDIVYAPEQGIRNQLKMSVFDENMEINDLGFNQRKNVKDIQYNFTSINSDLKRFRNTQIGAYMRYGENFSGHRISNAIGGNVDITLNNLSQIQASISHWPRRFEDRESYGNGTFRLRPRQRLRFEYRTNPSETFAYGGTLTYQAEDMKGRKAEGELEFTWYPQSNISFETELKYVDGSGGWLLHQQEKDFTSFFHQKWETEFKFNYFINAKQQLSVNLQWVGIQAHENKFYEIDAENYILNEINKPYEDSDNFSISDLSVQLRYRWQIAPLSDVYFVATKSGSNTAKYTSFGDLAEDTIDRPLSDEIILKLRYRFGS